MDISKLNRDGYVRLGAISSSTELDRVKNLELRTQFKRKRMSQLFWTPECTKVVEKFEEVSDYFHYNNKANTQIGPF